MSDPATLAPLSHLCYLVAGISLTIWVARTLRLRGRVFLTKGCKGNDELVDSLSHLFSVGFYLFHIGFLLLALRLGGYATGLVPAMELLSTKIGVVLVVLGVSHFAHIALYARIHGKPRPVQDWPGPISAEVIEGAS